MRRGDETSARSFQVTRGGQAQRRMSRPPRASPATASYDRRMKLLWVLVFVACSSKKEEPPPEPKEDKGLFGKLEDKAKDMAEDVGKKAIEDKAKGIADDLGNRAKGIADKAKDVANQAG